jgi:hypothetical protein
MNNNNKDQRLLDVALRAGYSSCNKPTTKSELALKRDSIFPPAITNDPREIALNRARLSILRNSLGFNHD